MKDCALSNQNSEEQWSCARLPVTGAHVGMSVACVFDQESRGERGVYELLRKSRSLSIPRVGKYECSRGGTEST